MITPTHAAHGSYWDSLATFALAGGGLFASMDSLLEWLGRAYQILISSTLAVAAAVSAFVALRRLLMDLEERKRK